MGDQIEELPKPQKPVENNFELNLTIGVTEVIGRLVSQDFCEICDHANVDSELEPCNYCLMSVNVERCKE